MSSAYDGTHAVGARNTRAAVAMVTARSRPAVVPISQISHIFWGRCVVGRFEGNVLNINGVVLARRTVVMTKRLDSRNTD